MIRKRIEWKLRYYYLKFFQKDNSNWSLYPAVRHASVQKADGKIKVQQYMTKMVHPTAGIGDQLASFITGYYYADLFSLSYAYSPLYPQSWNEFFGFHEMEAVAKVLGEKGYRKIRLPHFEHKNDKELQFIKKIIESYNGRKVIFYIENNHIYGEQFEVADKLRNKFNAASSRKKDNLIYNKECLNIAVHVRRGDITIGQLNRNPKLIMRWLDNEYYVKILRQLLRIVSKKYPYKIYLFSQGNPEEFKEFKEFHNVVYCLDMGAQESFLHLMRADIIIISKSSFSYKPALLAEGIRICPKNFWHGYPQNDKWIVIDEREPKLDETMKKNVEQLINRR